MLLDINYFIKKLMDYYHVETITELSIKLEVGQPTISKWRKNNSYNSIIKKCKQLNIYDEIFNDLEENKDLAKFVEVFQSLKIDTNNENNLLKYILALQSVAIATNNEDELLNDVKQLLNKYINKQ